VHAHDWKIFRDKKIAKNLTSGLTSTRDRNMNREEALKLLNLNSPSDLTVGHVEKVIEADPKTKVDILAHQNYWYAFHLLKLERDTQRKSEFQFSERSNEKRYPLRRDMGDLIYAIDTLSKPPSTHSELKEWQQRLDTLIAEQEKSKSLNKLLTEKIIELEKQIAALNNDKSDQITQEFKAEKSALIKKEIADLKTDRSKISDVSAHDIFLCQQRILDEEEIEERIQTKIAKLKSELEKVVECVQLFSVVFCKAQGEDLICFIGPFQGSRAIPGVAYLWCGNEIAKLLQGKRKGEFVNWNNVVIEITNIALPDIRWLQGMLDPTNWQEGFLSVLPDWNPLGWNIRDRASHPELWSRSPSFSNNSRNTKGG
jgi:hypothetical protein